jgi:diaminohydroxyphosphoribosylaminopyrimidine deaminase/5-amino-6-(5-phosphoribosylamino)uracil reductase
VDSKNLKEIFQTIKSLSFLAMGRTSPNPPVAAVISDSMGNIIATGITKETGSNHAEREAYQFYDEVQIQSKALGLGVSNSHQLFVSLEPCTHFGKTPPCRDLVIEKNPDQLTIGWRDPNPLVKSSEWEVYSKANIKANLHPMLAQVSVPFLHGFFQRINKKRPWVWIKSAVTQDGYYAPNEERQIQISSEASGYYLQILRAKFDAIVVGPKTIEIDAPGLDFRIDEKSFECRGSIQKLDSSDLTPFFEPGPGFLNSLLMGVGDEAIEWYTKELGSYQPFRVFILKDGQKISDSFLTKQKNLNDKFGRKLCLFYILQNSNDTCYSESELEKLRILSDQAPTKVTVNDSDLFFMDLARLGINTVMLEAGSFLWDFVKDNLIASDCILTIQSEQSIGAGKKFVGLNQLENSVSYKVGRDIWQLEFKS